MKPIGGFLGLELPRGSGALHAGATALASGRACLAQVLRTMAPRRIFVPFYVCEAVCQAIDAAGLTPSFYAIDERLTPQCDPPADGDAFLVVNYFGVQTAAVDGWADASRGIIVDDCQAFFRLGRADRWSFNSARKFFGVPDGAYLYGPVDSTTEYPASVTGDADYLLQRLHGGGAEALTSYRSHEHRFTADVRAMSPLAHELLAAVDYDRVAAQRRQNFARVHHALGEMNRLDVSLGTGDVPLYYPFWPEKPLAHERLWDANVFSPRLWPEIEQRPVPGFSHERQLARELLPLPIDQRYDGADMDDLCARLRAHS